MAEPAFYSTTDLRAILCKAPGLPRSPVRVPSLRASRPFLHPCVRVWPWSRPCPVRSPMFPLCSPGGRTANPRRSRFACGRRPRRRESVRARVTGGAAPPRASACSCFRTITCCLQSISEMDGPGAPVYCPRARCAPGGDSSAASAAVTCRNAQSAPLLQCPLAKNEHACFPQPSS